MAVKRGAKGQASPKRTSKRKAGKTTAPTKATTKPSAKKNTNAKLRATRRPPTRHKVPAAEGKNPVGRPTDYRPEMCELVRALGSEGKSKAQIAFVLGISRTTWHAWCEVHTEFLNAVKDAEWAAQAWWEEKGQEGIGQGKDFNATSWIFQMKNRFRADYRDERLNRLDVADPLTAMLREFDGATGRFRTGG